eukprot:1160705-Pelagomonas_calceolata.AAC.23
MHPAEILKPCPLQVGETGTQCVSPPLFCQNCSFYKQPGQVGFLAIFLPSRCRVRVHSSSQADLSPINLASQLRRPSSGQGALWGS